jgi:hypothetical protein
MSNLKTKEELLALLERDYISVKIGTNAAEKLPATAGELIPVCRAEHILFGLYYQNDFVEFTDFFGSDFENFLDCEILEPDSELKSGWYGYFDYGEKFTALEEYCYTDYSESLKTFVDLTFTFKETFVMVMLNDECLNVPLNVMKQLATKILEK